MTTVRDIMCKPNVNVFFGFMTLFTQCESGIDHISDDSDIKKINHTEYVDWGKISEPTV